MALMQGEDGISHMQTLGNNDPSIDYGVIIGLPINNDQLSM